MTIDKLQDILEDIFTTSQCAVADYDTVYEKIDNTNYYKLIITLNGLLYGDKNVIHTKFIFRVNDIKTELIDTSFLYLYDINCNYKKVDFEDIGDDLINKIKKILDDMDFGEDITILSDFMGSPSMFINYYLKRENITEYSVFDVVYMPKFKRISCELMTFDFNININDVYNIKVSIKKHDENNNIYYKILFKFENDIINIKIEHLNNIHFVLGDNISKILKKHQK